MVNIRLSSRPNVVLTKRRDDMKLDKACAFQGAIMRTLSLAITQAAAIAATCSAADFHWTGAGGDNDPKGMAIIFR